MIAPMRVLLGVSGGIAAYKTAELVRRLRERGHEVECALTRNAAAFVAPLTLEVLSGRKVHQEDYLEATGGGEEEHVEAARRADVLVVAPATANVLARLALGIADDFLTTTALAFAGPLVVAPAMHPTMWEKASVQEHLDTLRRRGARVVGPVEGPLASGEVGMGRMAESEALVAALEELAAAAAGQAHRGGEPRRDDGELAGKTVLVTAGPTHEPLDPVRFLGNRSSGRMGFALAAEAARRGARVVLVAGPVALVAPPGVERVDVETAEEMAEAVRRAAGGADLIVMAAAVADFRPRRAAAGKLRKAEGVPRLELEESPDILAEAALLAPRAVRVGFAAETEDLAARAREKLVRKACDFVVANDVSRSDIAFGQEANEVTVFRRQGDPVFFSRRPKDLLAADLLDLFTPALAQRERSVPSAR